MLRTPDELFGLEVQAQREDLGWSMTEFASKLSDAGLKNFHPTTVGRMERGERPVRLSEAVVIAEILGSRLDDLVVEPLPGDSELRHAADAVEHMSKKAARCINSIAFWREELQNALKSVQDELAEGKTLEEHIPAVKETCSRAQRILDADSLQYWLTKLEGMTLEQQRDLYSADSGFRLGD